MSLFCLLKVTQTSRTTGINEKFIPHKPIFKPIRYHIWYPTQSLSSTSHARAKIESVTSEHLCSQGMLSIFALIRRQPDMRTKRSGVRMGMAGGALCIVHICFGFFQGLENDTFCTFFVVPNWSCRMYVKYKELINQQIFNKSTKE